MPRQKSKETLFNELIDLVDGLNVFSMGGRFNEWQSSLYDDKGDGRGHGELALRTKIRNIIGSAFNEMNFGGKKNLDLHDVDVEALDRRVLRAPTHGGQDIKACVDGNFRDEGSHDTVRRLMCDLTELAIIEGVYTLELREMFCGTLSAKHIETIRRVSSALATLAQNTLLANALSKRYPEGIQVVNKHGHIGVLPCDYGAAFECVGISKGVAKYRLARSYIERRLCETLALLSQDVPNSVSVDTCGHEVDEPIVVACSEHPTTVFT